MKKHFNTLLLSTIVFFSLNSCKKDEKNTPDDETPVQLKLAVEFDATLPRLGNFGEEVAVPAENAAQSPKMNEVSIQYIEFAPDSLMALGTGSIVYQGVKTTKGGEEAFDFDESILVKNGEEFIAVDLSSLTPGTYNWLRVSLSYQNYDIDYRLNLTDPVPVDQVYSGTLASFVGVNTYIESHTVKDSVVEVKGNKVQGYWAFETSIDFNGVQFGEVETGDGAGVTVVNPINATSPIEPGSCVVTGKLAEPLVITGEEAEDIEVVMAFSINNSFEWKEVNVDGLFEPGAGETVVDMGLRGLHPYKK